MLLVTQITPDLGIPLQPESPVAEVRVFAGEPDHSVELAPVCAEAGHAVTLEWDLDRHRRHAGERFTLVAEYRDGQAPRRRHLPAKLGSLRVTLHETP